MSFSSEMPFSRARARTASTISCDIALVPHEVRSLDVGVGDRHHAGVGGDGHHVVGGAEQLAGEAGVPVLAAARPDARAPAEIAAEVVRLGQRALRLGLCQPGLDVGLYRAHDLSLSNKKAGERPLSRHDPPGSRKLCSRYSTG